jgi:hypothetical protein
MKKLFTVLGLLGCCTFAATLGAAESTPQITGLYSDMWYLTGKKQIIGTEIFILQNQLGYIAMVQCATGAAGTPFIAPIVLKGNSVVVEIPARDDSLCCAGRFTGTIVEKQLRGKFEGCNNGPVVLVRKNSYWQ